MHFRDIILSHKGGGGYEGLELISTEKLEALHSHIPRHKASAGSRRLVAFLSPLNYRAGERVRRIAGLWCANKAS